MDLCIIGQERNESNLKLLEEAKKKFTSVFFVPVDGIGIGLSNDFSISYRSTDILKFGAILPIIPKQYFSYAYQLLSLFHSNTFMPIKPISFLLADERFFLLTVLRKRHIPTTNLYSARSTKAAHRLIEESKFPIIIRSLQKKPGIIVNNSAEAKNIIETLNILGQPVSIEEPIKNMISVYVAEPDVIAAVKKKTKEKDIIFSKGILKKHNPNIEEKHLAIEAARAVDAHIARVDISTNGEPKVVDINLNFDMIKPSEVTGINIPERIVNSVYENYKNHKDNPMLFKFFDDAKSVMKDALKAKQLL
ncbi:MAG: hypothetical protein KKB03_04165 [Nanoarchaeota archaeon]|nr:hypothetical protein [Nanoarchaeota archaeon]MBU1135521.1 hypothetical protein [Nanoarchaeota archaeon]MBU2520409.1 hypothetical protein [Nanoarchaeota archaeon]